MIGAKPDAEAELRRKCIRFVADLALLEVDCMCGIEVLRLDEITELTVRLKAAATP